MPTVRAFLAIPLHALPRQQIASLQTELSGALPGIRWVRPDTIHLTLRFFGDANTDTLEKIRTSMLSVALRAAPFQVEACGLGAFPGQHRPRVVWLGLNPEEPLDLLYRNCQQELAKAGIAAEARDYSPHLTLGRFRERGPDLTPLLVRYEDRAFGPLPVEQLVLFESRLRPGGASHIPLFTAPLRGAIY